MAAQELRFTSLFADANLVAYYRLEDVNDSKGSRNLVNNNTVAFNAAQFNNGADQGASNTNKSLYYADQMGFGGKDNCSFSFWIKLKSEITTGTWTLMDYSSLTVGTHGYIDINYEYNGGTQRIYVDANGSNGTRYAIALGTSSFHHVVVTGDGVNAKLYIDGSLVITQAFGAATPPNNQFDIGAANNQVSQSSAIFDDFAVFSRVLSAQEVSDLFTGADATTTSTTTSTTTTSTSTTTTSTSTSTTTTSTSTSTTHTTSTSTTTTSTSTTTTSTSTTTTSTSTTTTSTSTTTTSTSTTTTTSSSTSTTTTWLYSAEIPSTATIPSGNIQEDTESSELNFTVERKTEQL